MYIPNIYREEDFGTLIAFMQTNSFATLISFNENAERHKLIASHIPLVAVIESNDDLQSVKLVGHLAKANPHWRAFGNQDSLAIFTGPHAYISPSLYSTPENVPTWNYIAVHAYGVPRLIRRETDAEEMEGMIDNMIESYEPSYQAQWHNLSEPYREQMMRGIVGFEMTVTRLEGKAKLSQNRSHAEQQTIAQALLEHVDPTIAGIGAAMQKNLSDSELP